MKNKIIIAAILSLFTISLFAQQKMANEQKMSKEEMAVKKVIENETMYYYQNNYDKWAECVVHDPMTYFTYVSPFSGGNGIWEAKGWEAVSKSVKDAMKDRPVMKVEDLPVKKNYHFKINGDMAFVTFQQGNGLEETRVMEKKNGQWRILRMEALASKAFAKMHDLYALQRLAGNWEVDMSTYKQEGGGNWKLLSGQMNMERTPTGLIAKETYYFKDEKGDPQTSEDVNIYSLDMQTGKIAAISSTYYPNSSWTSVHHGTAEIDEHGALVGKGTRVGKEDEGTLGKWTMKMDGDKLYWAISVKDKDGKEVYSSSCSFRNAEVVMAKNKEVNP